MESQSEIVPDAPFLSTLLLSFRRGRERRLVLVERESLFVTGIKSALDILDPKFSSWSKTELWEVVDVEPMPVFGKFYNG